MATYEDLKEVLKESLQAKGVINKVKANIRSEIFKSIDDEDQEKPKLSYENLIVNELIREYLEFNNYKFALSVFLAESNQPNEALDKNFLTKELKVKLDKDSQKLPLLYGLAFQNFTEKNYKQECFLWARKLYALCIVLAALLTASTLAVAASAAEVEKETSTGTKGTIFFDTGDWNSTKLQFYIWDDTNGMKATKSGWIDGNPWGSQKKLGGTLREDLSGKDGNKGNVFESYEIELESDHVYCVIFYDPETGSQTFDCCLSVEALGDTAYIVDGPMLEAPVDSEKKAVEAEFRNSGLGAKLCLTSSGKLQGSTIPVGTNCPGEVATFIFKYLGQKEKISGEDIVTKDIVKKAIEAFGTTADDVWAEYQKHEGEENYQADEAKAVLGLSGSENPDPQPQPIGPALGDVDGDGVITSMDSFVILRVSVGLESYSEDQTKLADVDADGEITSGDAFFVLRRSVGLTTPYAIG